MSVRVCQVAGIGLELITCPATESGGYRCERTDPHGHVGHRVGDHTLAHVLIGNGYSCATAHIIIPLQALPEEIHNG